MVVRCRIRALGGLLSLAALVGAIRVGDDPPSELEVAQSSSTAAPSAAEAVVSSTAAAAVEQTTVAAKTAQTDAGAGDKAQTTAAASATSEASASAEPSTSAAAAPATGTLTAEPVRAGELAKAGESAAVKDGEEKSGNPVVAYFTQSPYHQAMAPLLVLTVVLAVLAKPTLSGDLPEGFTSFQYTYLIVWAFCVAGDWFQGPYVFALYAAYGFNLSEIAQLFVAGFGSSLVFGMFVGSFIDNFGRKNSCIVYCILYIGSCITKHWNDYNVLLFGRLLGGICTSLLFSCFECWLVGEHLQVRKYSGELLGYMFGMMFSLMYFVAIATGIVAESISVRFPFEPISEGSTIYSGGYCVPFDLAIVSLTVGMILIMLWWDENYGSNDSDGTDGAGNGFFSSLWNALVLLFSDCRIICLCIIVACYEASMYAFVFHWTPALESKIVPPPHGVIFACFMMACMCGASGSTILSGCTSTVAQLLTCGIIGIAAFGLLTQSAASAATDRTMLIQTFGAFMAFEFCVGIYFPRIGVLKSEIVPESIRGVMYNLFRLPLNGLVLVLLLGDVPMTQCFELCMGLCIATFLAFGVIAMIHTPLGAESIDEAETGCCG
eukprot:TRINITY_DN10241_c0_g3_i1.p1 TRINITY_DN10241_c0_g3~~TRINITY_DN10241_c0_g3_i1.p1  ORF type:complete len:606 (-),score=114.99 TRINITY_DN10241_c0_g3_i1:173-1990(-)